jgi:glycosyltransferase involved in cell wall biosynthesis
MRAKTELNREPLQVVLEGSLFEQQSVGGISRIYHEILPRVCSMDERVLFSILTSGSLRQPLPQHPQIVSYSTKFLVQRLLRPQTIFWPLQDYLRAKIQVALTTFPKNTVWHATYFQLPHGWEGPKVVTVYDLIHEKFPEFFYRNYDNILRKRKKNAVLAADKVICISEAVRLDVIEMYGVPSERVAAIPLAYSDTFRPMTRDEAASSFRVDRPFILYVGTRHPYKNFKTLLQAYVEWSRRNEIGLFVVGPPWSKEEQRVIAAAGMEANIACRSGITDEELCALYNQALAFVYPSLAEGFGIPLLEALACGCPIVASRIPTSLEVARDDPYYFNPLDKDELIAALEAACFSGGARTRRGDILADYSWDRNARATLRIYEELALCV